MPNVEVIVIVIVIVIELVYMAKTTTVVGVIGSGQMGSGIAQLAAVHGSEVYLLDSDPAALTRATKTISDSLSRFVSKGQLSQVVCDVALRRLKCTHNLEDLKDADFVIEAIVESEDVKKKLFSQLDKIVKSSGILASTLVIGMHFMNPPPIMKLVEIVRGTDTSDETFSATKLLAERFGKTVICSNDYAGFIVNRILMPMINEAFYTLYTGVATKEDIDSGMKLGTNHPMGPLELADFIGLDVCLSILKVLHAGLGDVKYAPCPLLVQYVDSGRLGRKRGVGVYNYGNALNSLVDGRQWHQSSDIVHCDRQLENAEQRYPTLCPCCSCFCFMKPQKGKPKAETASEAKLEAKQGAIEGKPNTKEKPKEEGATGKADKETKLETKDKESEEKPKVKEGGWEKPAEVADAEKKQEA
ncbi:unnamed protein product [Rhodiola kirilowii]